jgi:hypothetical protein
MYFLTILTSATQIHFYFLNLHPICKGLRQSFKVSYIPGVLVFKFEDENLFVFLLARLLLSFYLRTPHMAQNLTLNRQIKLFHSLAFFGKCFSFISFYFSVCGKSCLLFFHPHPLLPSHRECG